MVTAPIRNSGTLCPNDVCLKMLWACYCYSRCFGIVYYSFERRKIANSNATASHCEHRQSLFLPSTPKIYHTKFRDNIPLIAYETKWMAWFNIISRIICCSLFFYGALKMWKSDDYFYIYVMIQVFFLTACPLVEALTNFRNRREFVSAINELLKLMRELEELQPNYKLFCWTHVALLGLKLSSFAYELACIVQEIHFTLDNGDFYSISLLILEMYLMVAVWLSLHLISILYICSDALFGALNHYMRHNFIPRIKAVETHIICLSSPSYVNGLYIDLSVFSDFMIRVQRNALDLHNLCQLLVVTTILFIYCGTICVIYYMVWQYYEVNLIHSRYIFFILKLLFDIGLLSLTGHRVIRASQLVRCMGLENAAMTDDKKWNREVSYLPFKPFVPKTRLCPFSVGIIQNWTQQVVLVNLIFVLIFKVT